MKNAKFTIKGFKRIQVEGYNQSRLLTELSKEGVNISRLEKTSPKSMIFSIDNKHSKKTFAILEKLCYNYKVIDSFGRKELIFSVLNRVGLVIGAIIFGTFSIIGGFFVWRIDIEGNRNIDSLVIERALKDRGIAVGSKKNSIDCFETKMILNEIEGIAESSVELIGTTLKITVFEDTSYTDPSKPLKDALYSGYDAQITRIVVEQGTANVKIGDNISAGSMLISGEVFDTNGESLGYAGALGQVYGIVNFSVGMVVPDTELREIETGNKQILTTVELFGLKIRGKNKIKFDRYKTKTTQKTLTRNLFVPINFIRTEYYETKYETIDNDIDKICEDWKKEKLLELVINCGGSEIQTIMVTERLASNLTKVDLFVQAEMPLIIS